MDDITNELRGIGDLITSAALLVAVREQVSKAMREGFVVTDGSHHPSAPGYEVVVRCGKEGSSVARRLRMIPDVEVDRIADGVLGVRKARRFGRDA